MGRLTLLGAGGAGALPVATISATVTYQSFGSFSAGSLNTQTGIAFGTEAANRVIVVGLVCEGTMSAVNAFEINGVSVLATAQISIGNSTVCLGYLAVPTGTTGSFGLNPSHTHPFKGAVWAVYPNVFSDPIDGDVALATTGPALDLVAGAVAVFIGRGYSSNNAYWQTGWTQEDGQVVTVDGYDTRSAAAHIASVDGAYAESHTYLPAGNGDIAGFAFR